MAEREYSEAEKQQAKVRLVRLDAEGNPVGVGETWSVSRFEIISEQDSFDAGIMRALQVKRGWTQEFPVSNETAKLLMGEE